MTDTPDLVPPRPPRRRRWGRLAVSAALVAQGAALYAALARAPSTTVVTRVEHTRTTEVLAIPMAPQLVPLPVAAPPSPREAVACPPPRTDAPSLVPPELPELVHGLAVSPTNAGWIAVWNDEHLFVSTDAGRTFARRLDGIGVMRAAQFDCFGRVIAERGGAIGVADGARETWRAVPGLALADTDEDAAASSTPRVAIIGGGRDLILVGTEPGRDGGARVAISRDRGASWAYHALSPYAEPGASAAGVQRADGSILVGMVIPDCMSEDLAWLEISPDGVPTSHLLALPGTRFQFWGDSIVANYGRRSLRLADDADWTLTREGEWGSPIPAPYPVIVGGDTASRLVGSTVRPYPWKLDGDDHQMDPAGRLWSIACGRPWIARAERTSGYCPE